MLIVFGMIQGFAEADLYPAIDPISGTVSNLVDLNIKEAAATVTAAEEEDAVLLVAILVLAAIALAAAAFPLLILVVVLRRVGEYALARPGREMLFTRVGQEARYKAKNVIVIKRSMSPGFAGIDNDLFYLPNTDMLFADAKAAAGELAVEGARWPRSRVMVSIASPPVSPGQSVGFSPRASRYQLLQPPAVHTVPSRRSWSCTVTLSPASLAMALRTSALMGSLWVPSPSAMNELSNGSPSTVPRTLTRPFVPK